MPRRQLLRTIGATLALGAIEALRPRRAVASVGLQPDCGGGCTPAPRKACCVQIKMGYHHGGCYTPPEQECCVGPNGETGKAANLMSWVCKKGRCGNFGQCKRDCRDQEECGSQCCPGGWFCADPIRSRCCQKGEAICLAPYPSRIAMCCKPGEKCCFNATGAKCCRADQTCVNGECICPSGQPTCGGECCAKNEPCLQQQCCQSPKIDCNGKCCDKGQCCQRPDFNECCPKGGSCVKSIRMFSATPPINVCCDFASILVTDSAVSCCPGGTVATREGSCCPPNNLGCCMKGGVTIACAEDETCFRGSCVGKLKW